MKEKELKKRLKKALEICSQCEVYSETDKKKCRDIPISKKISSGIGCGLWKEGKIQIIDNEVFEALKTRVIITKIINDISKI
jgi:hypothetical protein